jgi:hypothetical protein
MGFWEEQEKRKTRPTKPVKAAPPSSQNAPEACATCDHVGIDVMLGICEDCFNGHVGVT